MTRTSLICKVIIGEFVSLLQADFRWSGTIRRDNQIVSKRIMGERSEIERKGNV